MFQTDSKKTTHLLFSIAAAVLFLAGSQCEAYDHGDGLGPSQVDDPDQRAALAHDGQVRWYVNMVTEQVHSSQQCPERCSRPGSPYFEYVYVKPVPYKYVIFCYYAQLEKLQNGEVVPLSTPTNFPMPSQNRYDVEIHNQRAEESDGYFDAAIHDPDFFVPNALPALAAPTASGASAKAEASSLASKPAAGTPAGVACGSGHPASEPGLCISSDNHTLYRAGAGY